MRTAIGPLCRNLVRCLAMCVQCDIAFWKLNSIFESAEVRPTWIINCSSHVPTTLEPVECSISPAASRHRTNKLALHRQLATISYLGKQGDSQFKYMIFCSELEFDRSIRLACFSGSGYESPTWLQASHLVHIGGVALVLQRVVKSRRRLCFLKAKR